MDNKPMLKKVALIKKATNFSHKFQTTFSCSLKSRFEQEELNKAKESVETQKTKKKKLINLLFLLINFLVVGGFLLYYGLTSGIASFKDLICFEIKHVYLLLAVVMVIFVIGIESLRIFILIKKSTGKKRFWLSVKTHIKGRYYDNITPFAIGGQPFQVFYLNSHDIKGDVATSIPLAKQIFTNIALSAIGFIVLILNIFQNVATSPVIIVFAVIGLICNGAIVFLMLLFSINKKMGAGLIVGILKILNKMHLIKNYEKTFFRVNRFILNYQRTMKKFTKNIGTFIIQVFLTFAMYICYYLIIYFIYLAFLPLIKSNPSLMIDGEVLSYLDILCCITMCDLCSSVMPLPGGTGAAEISFDTLFGRWFPATIFPWAMLIWRTLSCYIYVILGAIQVACSYFNNLRVNKKKKDI